MLMPGGGPGPQYKGKPERTFKSLGPEFEFWELDPEPYLDDLSGIRVALQQRKRELGASQGLRLLPLLRRAADRQLPLHGVPEHLVQHEARRLHLAAGNPHPTDPQKCYFDMWYLTLFPEGVERVLVELDARLGVGRPPGRAPDRARSARCRAGRASTRTSRSGTPSSRACTSRGFRGEYMPWQERRIRFFHDTIDRWLDCWGRPVADTVVVDLGDLSDLADGELRCSVTAGPFQVVVCRVGGRLYALEDKCSHAETPLSEGLLEGYVLTCPLHFAQFDVRDGTHPARRPSPASARSRSTRVRPEPCWRCPRPSGPSRAPRHRARCSAPAEQARGIEVHVGCSIVFQNPLGLSDAEVYERELAAWPSWSSRSASTRSGPSSTTSPTTRCAPTRCSSSRGWRPARAG